MPVGVELPNAGFLPRIHPWIVNAELIPLAVPREEFAVLQRSIHWRFAQQNTLWELFALGHGLPHLPERLAKRCA